MRRIEGPDTSLALAKHAVFSQWPEVRKSAAAALKTRAFEDFVPTLISMLATPFKSELQVASLLRTNGRNGQYAFVVSYVLFRETGDQFQTATLRTTNYQLNDAITGAFALGRSADAEAQLASRLNSLPSVKRSHNDTLRMTADEVQARERIVQEFNERTEELNGRIGAVLAAVSGNAVSSKPQDWWDWWRTESDTQLAGSKETVAITEDYILSLAIQILVSARMNASWRELPSGPSEVWFRSRRSPSATASFLKTSNRASWRTNPCCTRRVRPPERAVDGCDFDQESLVLTGGHRLWCSGSGWVKARDLEPLSMNLHTATGSTPASTVKKAAAAETYNLMVADFHTYFVGKTGLLCQDVLTPRGTDCLVPGLSRANAVARK